MKKAWNGHERRTPAPDGREGRRKADQHCGEHFEIQNNTKEHRATVCGKIKEVKDNLAAEVEKLEKADADTNKNIVGKYWFRFVVAGLVAMIIYVADMSRSSNKEQTETLKAISVTVNSIENTQIQVVGRINVFEQEIKRLNERQDTLRDAHLKLLDNQKR